MSRYLADHEDWDDDGFDDQDEPQEIDLDDDPDDDGDDVTLCTTCGAEVSTYAERCPSCGDWVVERRFQERHRHPAVILLAALLLLSLFGWLVSRL